MSTDLRCVVDRRQEFARRFAAIGKAHGVQTEGLLLLGDTDLPAGVCREDGEPIARSVQASEAIQSEAIQSEAIQSEAIQSEAIQSEATASNNKVSPATDRSRVATRGYVEGQAPTLIVPGLLGDSVRNLVAPLLCARTRLEALGYQIDVAWVNGRTGCARNAKTLREQVLQAAELSGTAVNIIAYSKGCSDCLHMLSVYPDTHKAVRSFVSLVGVVHGTPLAQDPPWMLRKLLQYAPVPGVPFGDGRAIVDMSSTVRQQWLEDHPLPAGIYKATVAAAPGRVNVSRVLKGSYDKLVTLRGANDSQVVDVDTMLPDSDLLAIANADHWAIALPIKQRLPLIARVLVNQNEFPRDVLLRTLLDHLHDVDVLQEQ